MQVLVLINKTIQKASHIKYGKPFCYRELVNFKGYNLLHKHLLNLTNS